MDKHKLHQNRVFFFSLFLSHHSLRNTTEDECWYFEFCSEACNEYDWCEARYSSSSPQKWEGTWEISEWAFFSLSPYEPLPCNESACCCVRNKFKAKIVKGEKNLIHVEANEIGGKCGNETSLEIDIPYDPMQGLTWVDLWGKKYTIIVMGEDWLWVPQGPSDEPDCWFGTDKMVDLDDLLWGLAIVWIVLIFISGFCGLCILIILIVLCVLCCCRR